MGCQLPRISRLVDLPLEVGFVPCPSVTATATLLHPLLSSIADSHLVPLQSVPQQLSHKPLLVDHLLFPPSIATANDLPSLTEPTVQLLLYLATPSTAHQLSSVRQSQLHTTRAFPLGLLVVSEISKSTTNSPRTLLDQLPSSTLVNPLPPKQNSLHFERNSNNSNFVNPTSSRLMLSKSPNSNARHRRRLAK